MEATIKHFRFYFLALFSLSHSYLFAQDFTADQSAKILDELPKEMKEVIVRIKPQIIFINKPKDFYGSYNGKSNVLALNLSLKNNPALLKRTILHEYAHLYDMHTDITFDRIKFKSECSDRDSSNNDFCNNVNQKDLKLSKDVIFQSLFGVRIDNRKSIYFENLITERSPDPYEFENERELFAVNFEYFMLDKEYKCRRPLQYNYFSILFSNFEPFPGIRCSRTYPFIKTDLASTELIHIDFERVYRIDYLQAAPAKNDFSGGFGHSMLRIALCAPERKVVNSECLKDTESHLVVSFRASVADEQISSLKGLKGNYPSNQYIMSLSSVVEEYTQIQYRDLMIFPLQLSRQQIKMLLTQMSLQHWSIERRYYFASNNCASELVNLFRSTFGTEEMFLTTPYKPLDLPEWLIKTGLMKPNNSIETIKSAEFYWQKTLDQLTAGEKVKFSSFLEFNFKKRNSIYSNAVKINPNARTNALIRLLEFKVYSHFKHQYFTELERVLKDLVKLDTVKMAEMLSIRNAGWILVDKSNSEKGYGIPDSKELLKVESQLELRNQALQDQFNKIADIVNSNSDVQTEELNSLKRKQEESKLILDSYQVKK